MIVLDPSAIERANAIRLLLLDVDGVLTDGKLIIHGDGSESKAFHARDGLGIRLLQRAELAVGFVSGRRSDAVARRAAELDIVDDYQGVADKLATVHAILRERGLRLQEVGFVGDDLVDVSVMRSVGFAATVSNAAPQVSRFAHVQTDAVGGGGAVREVCEFILAAQGRWDDVLESYGALDR